MLRLSSDNDDHCRRCLGIFIRSDLDILTIMLDDMSKYMFMFSYDYKNNRIGIKNFKYLVNTFVDESYKKEVFLRYKALKFEVVDMKTGIVFRSYIFIGPMENPDKLPEL